LREGDCSCTGQGTFDMRLSVFFVVFVTVRSCDILLARGEKVARLVAPSGMRAARSRPMAARVSPCAVMTALGVGMTALAAL